MQRQPIKLTEADAGVPTEATCQECGETWRRPAGDTHADSLTVWGRRHLHPELPV